MTESTWITTHTMPDGTFDFFRFAAWLHTAPLLELQVELLYVETCAAEFGKLAEITIGKGKDKACQKANLFNSLWCLIDNEIFDRCNPVYKPQSKN